MTWRTMVRSCMAFVMLFILQQEASGQLFTLYLDTGVFATSDGAQGYATAFFVPYGYVQQVRAALYRDGHEVSSGWAGQSYAPCTAWVSDLSYPPPYTHYSLWAEAEGEVPDYGWYWMSGYADAMTPGPQVTIQVEQGKQQGTWGYVLRWGTTNLTAIGSPSGGSYEWSIGPKLQFAGSSTSGNTSVQGDGESEAPGDTWVQVAYNVSGHTTLASIRFSVRTPRRLEAPHIGGPNHTMFLYDVQGNIIGYITTIPYFVQDQFSPPETIELEGIPVTELLATVHTSHPVDFDPPDGEPKTAHSNIFGKIHDHLSVGMPNGMPIPGGFSAQRNQTMYLDGYILWPSQVQTYGPTSAQVSSMVLSW